MLHSRNLIYKDIIRNEVNKNLLCLVVLPVHMESTLACEPGGHVSLQITLHYGLYLLCLHDALGIFLYSVYPIVLVLSKQNTSKY